MTPLSGMRVLTLAINLPGPVAVARLHRLGATVVKVEPPAGDPLAHARREWYDALHEGVTVLTLDLKRAEERQHLEAHLAQSDLLLTASRLAALGRLGLDWSTLHTRHPRLCQVALIGEGPPHEDRPGHDLTYQALAGLLDPPHLPRSCMVDLAGAQQVVATALALLLGRERGQGTGYAQVSLAEMANDLAAPWHYQISTPDGVLGGAHPGYNLYCTAGGWIALAALEVHFWEKLTRELGVTGGERAQLQQVFLSRTAAEWESWALERNLPLVRVRDSEEPCSVDT